jgi:hypothetical protein
MPDQVRHDNRSGWPLAAWASYGNAPASRKLKPLTTARAVNPHALASSASSALLISTCRCNRFHPSSTSVCNVAMPAAGKCW